MPDPRPFAGRASLLRRPEPRWSARPTGRPRRHGPKMKCADPSTWPEPSAEYTCEDAGYGSGARARLLEPASEGPSARTEGQPRAFAHRGRDACVWWRWSGCLVARGGESRACCGCGGMARKGRRRTSICSGALTSGASTWSIPSAFSSRPWDGPRLGCVTPSRRTGGRGWW